MSFEQALLGTIIYSPELMLDVEQLTASDFTGSHQTLWAEMVTLFRRDALEPLTLTESLRDHDVLHTIGAEFSTVTGEKYIEELLRKRGSNVQEYAARVIEGAVRREVRTAAALIMAEAQDTGMSMETVLDNAERSLFQIRRAEIDVGETLGDIIGAYMPRVEGLRDGTITPAWVPHNVDLRRVISYVDSDDYVIIAGRPGDGKSAFMRFELFQSAWNGRPAMIFNLENGRSEYARYLIALDTSIDSAKIKSPRELTANELKAVKASAEKLAVAPLHIVTMGGPSIKQIERILREGVKRHSVKLAGIDYIQLVNNGNDNRYVDVTVSSQAARAMAINYGIPVMAAAQLSRGIEHRGQNAEPMLSDLRDSGSLEQDGTIIMFARHYWNNPTEEQIRQFPENYDPQTSRLLPSLKAVPIRLYVRKNRNGPIGTTPPIKWTMSTGNYQSLAHDENIS